MSCGCGTIVLFFVDLVVKFYKILFLMVDFISAVNKREINREIVHKSA